MSVLWRLQRWVLLRRALPLPVLVGRVIVVAPHPDDETIGAGAVVARAAANGAEVQVIVVSDGAASHDTDDRDTLVQQRKAEALAATARLGVVSADVAFLSIPDQAVGEHSASLIDQLGDLASADWVIAPHIVDANPDHRATAAAVAHVVERQRAATGSGPIVLSYPVWYWHRWAWMTTEASRPRRLLALMVGPTSGALTSSVMVERSKDAHRSKVAALLAYESQLNGWDGDESMLSDSVVGEARSGTEMFFLDKADRARIQAQSEAGRR